MLERTSAGRYAAQVMDFGSNVQKLSVSAVPLWTIRPCLAMAPPRRGPCSVACAAVLPAGKGFVWHRRTRWMRVSAFWFSVQRGRGLGSRINILRDTASSQQFIFDFLARLWGFEFLFGILGLFMNYFIFIFYYCL